MKTLKKSNTWAGFIPIHFILERSQRTLCPLWFYSTGWAALSLPTELHAGTQSVKRTLKNILFYCFFYKKWIENQDWCDELNNIVALTTYILNSLLPLTLCEAKNGYQMMRPTRRRIVIKITCVHTNPLLDWNVGRNLGGEAWVLVTEFHISIFLKSTG